MSHNITPGSSRPEDRGSRRSQPSFVTDLVRRHGLRAILAILVAALFAFAPLAALYWFNALRLQSVNTLTPGQRVVVKSGERHDEQEREEPGETALLQVTCDVPNSDGWQELLGYDDPAQPDASLFRSRYVRHEQVYLRRAGSSRVPFGLLGPPPVSVWLPAGDYEILVVYEAPRNESRIDAPGRSFPWLSVFSECSLESRHKTVCRVPLPHYDSGNPDLMLGIGNLDESAERKPLPDELAPLLTDCETLTSIPTPAGYVLNLSEPLIHHREGHRDCVQDFQDLHQVPREWTRNQIATLRNWLPADAVQARTRLAALVDQLLWREFLQGWFCYAAAGISGLVFTRWGAIALLEPWQRGNSWRGSLRLIVRIFLFSIAAWFVLQILSDSSGCHGPTSFRIH